MKDLSLWIQDYLESLKGRNLSRRGAELEGRALNMFHREFWGDQDFRQFQESDFYGYVQYLKGKISKRGTPLAPKSVDRYVASLKLFCAWLYRHSYFLVNPLESVKLNRSPKTERKIPSRNEMEKVLDGIDDERDRALFELIYSSGLRIEETLNLELSDVKFEERILLIREGKGQKDRFVPFCQIARMHLLKYIQGERARLSNGLPEEQRKYVFIHTKGRLQWHTAMNRWKAALLRVDLAGKGYTIHSIRHATATHLLEAGASVRYVQELLGHESLSTTQRYARPTQDKVRAIYRSFHPRENEFFREIDQEYLKELEKLKQELVKNTEAKKRKNIEK